VLLEPPHRAGGRTLRALYVALTARDLAACPATEDLPVSKLA
jgi:hypothetical protein